MAAARKNNGDPEKLKEIHILYKKMMVEHWEVFANDLGPRRDRFVRAWPGRNQEQMWQVVWDLFCGVHEIERFVKICREYAMQETDDEYAKRTAKGEMHWSHPMWKPPSERRRNASRSCPVARMRRRRRRRGRTRRRAWITGSFVLLLQLKRARPRVFFGSRRLLLTGGRRL